MNNSTQPALDRGYTLIETLVSLFIFSVLVGMSSSSFLSLAPKYKLKKAAWEISSRLNFARYKAVLEGDKVRVSFEPTRYRIERYDTSLETWKLELENVVEGVSISANNSPLFHPEGTVSNLASISVVNSWGEYKITIAITGRIRVILI